MAKHPRQRYPDGAAMRAALDWIEVESAKQNPQTQDIAPWMETSHIGSIPVPALASSLPPAIVTSSHPPGKVLRISAARPVPADPVLIERRSSGSNRRWVQITLLLMLLGSLVSSGFWWKAQLSPDNVTAPAAADQGANSGE